MLKHSFRGVAAATLAAAFLVSCDDATSPPGDGAIAPRLSLVRSTSALANALGDTVTAVDVIVTGENNFSKRVQLLLNTTTDRWTGRVTGLPAGTYTVRVEGRFGSTVVYYGRLPNVSVVRGETATPEIQFRLTIPAASAPVVGSSNKMTQLVSWDSIPAATSYAVQVSKDPTFATGLVVDNQQTSVSRLVSVPDTGTWHVRTRAAFPDVAANDVPWSPSANWNVTAAPGGRTPSDAVVSSTTVGSEVTVTNRNIWAGGPPDWHTFNVRVGDSIIVTTKTATASSAPSDLNTSIALFRADGTTPIGLPNDVAGVAGFDSRLVVVAPSTESVKLRVSAVSDSKGHYDLSILVKRLPFAPANLASNILDAGRVTLTWTDTDDQETAYAVDRCTIQPVTSACTFAPVDTTLPVNASTFTDATVSAGNIYRWRVRARNTYGSSINSPTTDEAVIGPNAPTGVAATTNSNTRITVTWNDVADNESGYEVQRCSAAGCSDFTRVDSLPAGSTSFVDATVAYNTTYRYRVRAVNVVVPSAFTVSNEANTIPPATPTGLTATVATATRINLTWANPATNETGIIVERCRGDSCSDFTPIDTAAVDAVSFADTTVSYNEAYRYRVRSFNVVRSEATSNESAADTRPPAAPTTLTATTINGTRIDLAWTDNSDDETGFSVQRCEGPTCGGTDFVEQQILPAGTQSFNNTVLTNRVYRYRVVALGVPGNSDPTAVATANTLLPLSPTTLIATTTSPTTIVLSWTDNSDNETFWDITRCAGSGCTPVTPAHKTIPAGTDTYTDTVTVGSVYTYAVRARNVSGPSTSTTNTATANTVIPAQPVNLNAVTVSDTRIDLSWTDAATTETAYEIERCTGVACTTFAKIADLPANAAAFSDVTVVYGERYRYQIRAVNAAGQSPYSTIIAANTIPPLPVSAFAAEVRGPTSIRLTWTDNANDETGYRIERCEGDTCSNYTLLANTAADAQQFDDNTVIYDRAYRYRIRSFNVIVSQLAIGPVNADTRPPVAPTSLVATTTSGTTIALSWTDNADDETGYRIERCTGVGCTDFTLEQQIPANSTTFQSSVVPGNVYRYQVIAVGIPGNSAPVGPAVANTILPNAPTGLTAVTVNAGRIDLSWTDNATNETQFVIERCAGNGCTGFAALGSASVDASSYSDATVQAGQSYSYRVRAANVAGQSDPTNAASANTFPPAAPSDVQIAVISGPQVALSWTNNAPEATGTQVERCTGAGCTGFTSIGTAAAGNSSFFDTDIVVGALYRYRLRAQNVAGVSDFTTVVEISTSLAAAVQGLTVTNLSLNQLELSWTASTGPGATGYVVERCTGVGCSNFVARQTLVGVATSVIDDVDEGADYRYRIRTTNVLGTGDPSVEVAASTRLPAAPTALLAVVTTAAVDLTWTDNSDNEASFVVQRACAGVGCVFADVATLPAGTTSYRDESVTANNAYQYEVRSANGRGQSSPTNVVVVSTALQPVAETVVATTTGPTQIEVTWNDVANNETGYSIERCSGDGCATFTQVGTVGASVESYLDTGLSTEQSYTYRVRTLAAFGSSVPSLTATATTRLPAAATDLVATTVASDAIKLTWTDNATNETGYQISACTGAGCTNFANVATTAANATEFTQTGLSANETYLYRVIAVNGAGAAAPSNTASATTNLPAAPTALTAEIRSGSIELSWTDNATDEVDQELESCTGPACADFTVLSTAAANAQAATFNAPVGGTTYRFRLRARNGAGFSAYSGVVEVVYDAPPAPTGLTATLAAGTDASLSFATTLANFTPGTITARFERCLGAGCSDFAAVSDVPLVVGQSYTLSVGTSIFEYRVRLVNALGVGAPSASVVVDSRTPTAPGTLVATAVSATAVNLTWVDSDDAETEFRIERCSGAACTNFAPLATVAANQTSYSDIGLTANTQYRYRVFAYNTAFRASAASNIATAATNLPATPTNLTAIASSPTSVTLNWTDNANNETDYLLERCEGAGCSNFGTLALLTANVTSYEDGSATAGQSYSYRVRAVGSNGPSAFSDVATVVLVEPSAPTGFTAVTTSGSNIALSWTDASNNELAFRLERCVGAGCGDFTEYQLLASNATSYQDAGVSLNTTYSYRLRATNNVGASVYVGPVTANTLLPATPSSLTATTVSADLIELAWTDNANNEAGYRIERCSGDGCSDFAVIGETEADKQGYQDLAVTPGNSYTYRMTAFNVSGSSGVLGPVTATTRLPEAPTGLLAVVESATQINMNWVDNATNELGYRIERCAGAGCTEFIEIGVVGPDVTFFASTGLNSNSFYTYRVRAFNAAGTSEYSANSSANTFPPAAPSALTTTTLTATSVRLNWTDNSGNELGFNVERCTGAGCTSFAAIGNAPQNDPQYTDTSVPAGVVVRYRVRAYNGVAASGFAAVSTASTVVPAAPTMMIAYPQGQGQIYTAWSDNSTDEAGFRVERCTGVGCTDFTLLTTTAANVFFFIDLSVAPGEAYRYRVLAFGNGSSAYSNVAEGTTILPAAPSALAAIALSDNRIDLTWTDNADNEDNIQLLRCTGADCTDYNEVALLAPNTSSYSDLSVAGGNLYRYVVRAVNGAGGSAFSTTVDVETNVPGLPSALTATVISAMQIDLAWQDNATTETGFEIERCTGETCTDFVLLQSVAADAVSYSDISVVASTAYRYRVRAIGAGGNSGYTNVATAATDAPAAPTDLVALTVTAGQISLSWTDNAFNEATYEIERCTGAGCSDFAPLVTLPFNVQSYNDLSVSVDLEYRYRVRASNAAGFSAYAEVAANTLRPAEPTNLTATTLSATQIALSWTDNATNEADYVVFRCDGASCTPTTQVAALPANTTSYNDVGLAAGSLYRYAVVARNAAGTLVPSVIVEASTDFPLPPNGITATVINSGRIDVTWNDNAGNETGYQIERCDNFDCESFTPLASVGANVTLYSDESVIFQNFYRYRVRAVNLAGVSDFSITGNVDMFPPGIVTGVLAEATSATTVTLNWPADPKATGYRVFRCEGEDCSIAEYATVNAPETQLVNDPVTTGSVYRYMIRAFNAAGAADVDAAQIVRVSVTPPAAPTGLATQALSSNQALLTWADNATDETGYLVQRCSGSPCSSFITIESLPVNSLNYQDNGLAPAGTYTYRVIAVNAVGESVASNTANVLLTPPESPTFLTATTTGPGQITLNWTDNSSRELVFLVERCTGAGCGAFVQVGSVGADVTQYVDVGLSLNAVYRYRVRALNNVGPSAFTNFAESNTFVPSAPSGLTATVVEGPDVSLSWIDNSSNETDFLILRCQGISCGDFALIQSVPANTVSFLDTSVELGAAYTYRVVANNISGTSPASPPVQVNTVLGEPYINWAQATNRTAVRLNFSTSFTFENGVNVYRCEGVSCTDPVLVAELGKGVGEYVDAGLNPGSVYRYALRHRTNKGLSVPSNVRNAAVPVEVPYASVATIEVPGPEEMRTVVTTVPANFGELRFKPAENASLYAYVMVVRRGLAPDLYNGNYDCYAFAGEGSDCTFNQSAGGGDWYVMVYPYQADAPTQIGIGASFQFNNCGATGPFGPDNNACSATYAGSGNEGRVATNAGVQAFTVPATGTYEIVAIGAQGASGTPGFVGGRGALAAARFALTAGDVLQLAVGQMGLGQGSNLDGGGGGGSFVVDFAGNPMLVAGGGGGTRGYASQNGCDASATPFGVTGAGDQPTAVCTVKNGSLGQGGAILNPWAYGAAGAGFFGNGADDTDGFNFYGAGGKSWTNGLTGGLASGISGSYFHGGFGGGGSGSGWNGGGGGGGYSGGDGGYIAGGGGTYTTGFNQQAAPAAGVGHGRITIRWVGP